MKVCFFGAYDPAYPRNRILREGLRRAGVTVMEARVKERRALFRYPALATTFTRGCRDAGVLLVPEFRHKDVPLARALAGRRPLVFDPLVSRHDTLVGDWGLHARGSAQARWNLMLDRWTLGLADRVLCDTWEHGLLYQELGVPRERLRRVLVGAEDAFFEVPAPPSAPPVRIAYVGGFLPLHGAPVMLRALARLERDRSLPAFECELVGKGIEFGAAASLATELALTRVRLPGPTGYAGAPAVLARAHIVLGAFGAGAKAGRVIPHKVYQGLAAGRAVVTGAGPGLLEVFEPGRHLVAVTRGDDAALAEALARLLREPETRATLGRRGRERALEIGSAAAVGRSLLEALGEGEGAGVATPRRAGRPDAA